MEKNNFEKKVQQKMEELIITPSDSVWTNVEKRIDNKKKDKRLLFLFAFLFLFLLSGSYWFVYQSKNRFNKNQGLGTVVKQTKPGKATNNDNSSFADSGKTIEDNENNAGSAGNSKKKIIQSGSASLIKIEKKKSPTVTGIIFHNQSETKEIISKSNYKDDEIDSKDTPVSGIERNAEMKSALITATSLENKIDNYATLSFMIFENSIDPDHISKQLLSEKDEKRKRFLEGIHGKKDSVNRINKRWDIGLTLAGGASLLGKGILEGSLPVADYTAGPLPGGIPSVNSVPSPIKNSTAFIAGILAEKKISKKTKLDFGISYKYYSLTNKVGKKITSTTSSAIEYLSEPRTNNALASGHSYRNNFHFLEVPLSLKFQLNNIKKVPLYWEAGINVSRLISSNALQFKSNPGIYFNDNSMLNKTGFGLHTGIYATLFALQKMPITVGPHYYYSATTIADKGLYSGKHFGFLGIKAEMLFPEK